MNNLPLSRSSHAVKNSASKARDPRRRFRLTRLLGLGFGLSLASFTTLQAGTEDDIINGQTDLTLATTYAGGLPTAASDVTFTNTAYNPAAFTLGSALTIGTLNDLSSVALTISGAGPLTLSGGSNSVAPNAADLLYVATGGSLTINATPITLAASGNFDIVGTASISGVISGTGFGLTKTGAGTLTLSGNNTYSGGTTVNAGTLILATGGGNGTIGGTLTINSGATVQAAVSDALGYSGTFVTTVNVNGGTFDNGAAGNNGYSTDFVLTGGTVKSTGGGAINFSNTGISSLASATTSVFSAPVVLRTQAMTINTAKGTTASGVDLNVSGGISGAYGITKTGAGTLVLSGTNSYTGRTTVSSGALTLTGSNTTTGGADGQYTAQYIANTDGVLNFSGGTYSGGNNEYFGAGNVPGLGTVNVTSGTVTPGQFLVAGIGNAGAYGIWNISGGSVTTSGNNGGTLGATAGSFGLLNVTGNGTYNSVSGNANSVNGIFVGESGAGVINVSGSGSLVLGGTDSATGLDLGHNNTNTASGIVNLGAVGTGGGTITTNIVRKNGGAASGIFNFHGGTLKSSATPNAAFMNGLTAAYVYSEGGRVDNNGQTITIGQALLAPTGSGANSAPAITSGGSNYLTAPFVTVTGAGGTGATAVATVSGGVVTGITITNPGVGYTGALSFTLTGGGGTGAAIGTVAQTTDVSGGLIFQGSGTTILSGTNTYTGATTVNGGALLVNGSLAGGSPVVVNNSGTILGGTGTIGGPVTINAGGMLTAATRGTGGAVVAANVGQLNVGALTLTSTSIFHADILNTSSFDLLNVTGTVGLGGSTLELNIAGGLTFAPGTSYTLIANDGTDAISGIFAGLAQGSTVTANGYSFTVNYAGGDGNDFSIVAVPEPSTWIMGVLTLGALGFRLRRRRIF